MSLVADPEDVGPLFRNSVLIVPIDVGGGTRLKILQALAAGCSVVSTRKGIEGIAARPEVHYLRADDTDAFVAAIVRILEGPAEDLHRRVAGWELVRSHYSWQSLTVPLSEVLAAVDVAPDRLRRPSAAERQDEA